MSYFLFNGVIELDKKFHIVGKEAQHIRLVRRIKPGETIYVQDKLNRCYLAKVLKATKQQIELAPLSLQSAIQKSDLEINLFQALVKEKALDFIIQKTTELGVSSITFFHSRHSQRLKTAEAVEKRIARWKKIALEACKQSGRTTPPAIDFVSNLWKSHQFFSESSIKTLDTFCLTSSGNTVAFDQVQVNETGLNLLVGPEGGWDESELEDLPGIKIHLGPRILRSETAAITAVAIMQFLHGDLSAKPQY